MYGSEVLLVLASVIHVIVSSSLSTPTPAPSQKTSKPYEIVDVISSCTAEELHVRVGLSRSFRGVIYAKGFPLEKDCRTLGTGDSHAEIRLSTSGCGVRLVPINEETLSFSVTLNIQTDKFLQQINDMEMTTTCKISPKDMVHTRRIAFGKPTSRTGRFRTTLPDALREEDALRSIRSWMEIEGTAGQGAASKVAVGEQTLVLVKALLPDDLTANVVDCQAHDGTSDVAQKLLDENGCPIDATIMPALETIAYEGDDENEIAWEETMRESSRGAVASGARDEAEFAPDAVTPRGRNGKLRMHVIGNMFPAFKFPDTANLHLKCVLQICRHFCPKVSCEEEGNKSKTEQNRTSKTLKSSDFSSIVDRLEVFNSVEVVAPGIDNDGYSSAGDASNVRASSGEKTFCLSASKMAFSFAILGAVFLCGVLAALWTVMRNQMRKMAKSYDGSEQILVVRDSPMNLMAHSRNKPVMSWSYT